MTKTRLRPTQQLELLPADPPRWGGPPPVPADPIATSGRTEYTVRCDGPDGCGRLHRHVAPGIRTAPCGAVYTVPDALTTDRPADTS
ncbi:hypothetical protein ACFOOM_07715 [Streptomyces echinoruber]|uniref:Uncharacterized protein n=1 Tax=Streptomyces echinoruber TaxID=68898 RepID=A0A918V8N6_9ACTN|nr:hypothetical protein [Streptomyces echinoruber]GGZ80423.1 hypothetical protein GCM10010389_17820 [Streptomyces echinoruber]